MMIQAQVDPRPRRKNATPLIAIASLTVVASSLIAGLSLLGLRVNLTPSEPLGLWRIISLERVATIGDMIFVCPPDTPAMRQARSRGYLRYGSCPGGIAPLIKTVAATGGQAVAVGGEVQIDGKRLAHSLVLSKDAKGRTMTPYRGGVVQPGTVYLHSDFEGSFDSRYFGPLPLANVVGLAQKVWTYGP